MGIAYAEEIVEGASTQIAETKAAASSVWESVANFATTTGIKIVIAIVILLITFKIINVLGKKLKQKVEASEKMDKTLSKTLCYAVVVGLKILVVV